LSKNSTEPLVDATRYNNIVGGLIYLVNTLPDLAFAVGYVGFPLNHMRIICWL
jgi:hypothetical protein